MTATRWGWTAAVRVRNVTGVSAAKLARVSGKLKSPVAFGLLGIVRLPTRPLRAPHRVDLCRPGGQRSFGPCLAAVLAGEHLAAARRAVHALGLSFVEGNGEHGGLRLEAHVHASPARAAVLAAEQDADVALEPRAGGQPDGLGIAWDLADVTTIRLTLRVQRLEPRARPVRALVRAGEESGAADRQHGSRTPAPDEDAVHVDGVVVDVLAVAHVRPVLATVETANDAADFDG